MNKNILRIILAVFAAACIIVIVLLLTHRVRQAVKPGRERPPTTVRERPAHKGTIAIVLDDFGYSSRNFEMLSQIQFPLTLSVLPNLPYSNKVCEQMHARFEIILHLPMEPKEMTKGLEANTILTSMDEAAISAIIERDLENLKYAKGVSNHMGSKATEDPETMKRIFTVLKRRGVFFLDSFVTPKSACASAAKAAGIHWTSRDVFLDNRLAPEYIRKQLAVLARKARANGSAVGIGHDRTITLEVLREEMPKMAAEGYTFVVVSDILN
jgi:uncharacterized protein